MIRVTVDIEKVDEATTTHVATEQAEAFGDVDLGRVYRDRILVETWPVKQDPAGDPGQMVTWCEKVLVGYRLSVYGADVESCKQALINAPIGPEEVVRALNPKTDEFRVVFQDDPDPTRLLSVGLPDGLNPVKMSDEIEVQLTRG